MKYIKSEAKRKQRHQVNLNRATHLFNSVMHLRDSKWRFFYLRD